jgi:hypothetical protein
MFLSLFQSGFVFVFCFFVACFLCSCFFCVVVVVFAFVYGGGGSTSEVFSGVIHVLRMFCFLPMFGQRQNCDGVAVVVSDLRRVWWCWLRWFCDGVLVAVMTLLWVLCWW